MKVLAIGNSYSQDGTRYLSQVAKSAGQSITVVNLYIGGCPLRKHYINALEDLRAYDLYFNGIGTGFKTSIKEALIAHDWDVVTLQQASRDSMNFDSYLPYLDFMAEYVKKYAPKAKIYIHQTWAYTQANCETVGFANHAAMLQAILPTYVRAAERIGAYGMIPSGEVMGALMEREDEKQVYRDAIHASNGLGRYALALTWYAVLTGGDVDGVAPIELDEPITEAQAEMVKAIVKQTVAAYRI